MVLTSFKQKVRTVPDFPKKGVQFLDLNPLYADPGLFRALTLYTAVEWSRQQHVVTAVCAIESRGFILGATLAEKMSVSFLPIRKPGKLPGNVISEAYTCEYGTDYLELQKECLGDKDYVLVVDDVLATGGTLRSAVKLVQRTGATVLGCAVIAEIEALDGRRHLPRVTSLIKF